MDLYFYKTLHILGVMLLFAGAGGLVLQQLQDRPHAVARKLAGLSHGIALVLILIAGFGAAAKNAAVSLTAPWLVAKMVIWLLFGLLPLMLRKLPQQAKLLWWVLPVLGLLAAYLAIYKPGIGG